VSLSARDLTERINSFARDQAGFDLVGISQALLPAFYGQALENWVEKGFAGSMGYMTRDAKRRSSVQEILPSAKSVISLAVNYYHPEDSKPEETTAGKIARYAYGADYHTVIESKLKLLSKFIHESAGSKTQVRFYVDTGPILEKAFARESGIGFFGKNTNIITRDYGSWVFLASIITNLDLTYDSPHLGTCGSCRRCIDACPTGALLGNYTLDAVRCISYLTIESKDEPPAELRERIGEWAFGCDICQMVCPYNSRAKNTREPGFLEKKAGSWLELEKIEKLNSDEEFQKMFQGSPLKRPKRKGLLRNIKTVQKNLIGGLATRD